MTTPRDKSIGAQMHIASSLLRRRMNARIQQTKHDITIEQLSILELVLYYGPQTMTDLARATVKENAVITRMVDILTRNGYVERKRKEGDRRAYLIHLTKTGKQVFETIVPHIIDELNDAVSVLTTEEYKEGLRIVQKIIKHNNT